MKNLIIGFIMLSNISFAKEISDHLKSVAQDGIRLMGYKCDKIDTAFQKWDDSIKVICDDYSAIFIIKKYGGRWTIEVEK